MGKGTCFAEGCERPAWVRQLCTMHYQRYRAKGLEMPPSFFETTPIERFVERIAIADGGCWLWTSARTNGGYGMFGADGTISAHRWSYEHFIGPIPDGLEIDHLCRVRACVNPDHLEPVTRAENNARRRLYPDCPAGHRLTDRNSYVRPNRPDRRICRTCLKERWLRLAELRSITHG